jgi:hypothetical protein
MEFTGGCVCGGTRYLLKSRPFALIDCHCIDCRRSEGAAFVTWGSVPRNRKMAAQALTLIPAEGAQKFFDEYSLENHWSKQLIHRNKTEPYDEADHWNEEHSDDRENNV